MSASTPKAAVSERANSAAVEALELSHRLHGTPELAFEEHHAVAWLDELLTRHGFIVHRDVAGLPTALVGEIGTGDLVVGLCAEYDALPEIGHACGHNVIAGAAALAAMALAPSVDELGLTLRVFGTPAEEHGGGKVVMVEAGMFDGTHAALMVHPAPHDLIKPTIAAHCGLDVEFFGETPPAMSPERGRNAGAAAVLLEVAVGLLRQNIRSTDRIAGVIREAGLAPGVLPQRSLVQYSIRTTDDDRLEGLLEQVRRCIDGAALATATRAEVRTHTKYSTLRHNEALGRLYQHNAEELGRVFGPVGADDVERAAATDFGNVSAAVHGIHPLIGIDAGGASNHQIGFADACGGPEGDRAVRDAGTALALTIVDLASDAELRRAMMADAPTRS
jgi:amidohydrolase